MKKGAVVGSFVGLLVGAVLAVKYTDHSDEMAVVPAALGGLVGIGVGAASGALAARMLKRRTGKPQLVPRSA